MMIKLRIIILTYLKLQVLSLSLFPLLLKSQNTISEFDSINLKKRTFNKALVYTSSYYAGSMFILSKTWYKDRKVVPFHFYNDNSGYLQVDKFGHTFGAYVYSYLGYHYLIKSGLSRNEALCYGATLGLILQTPIEIMDGIHQGYGFSLGDMAANLLGSAFVLGQELVFHEQIVKYKFSYWESEYAHKANGYLGETTLNRILKDYNGQTYWLSFPFKIVVPNNKIPKWLNIAFGYGANGMYGEFENITSYHGVDIPKTIRYRQYLVSLDIDWTKIQTRSKVLRTVLKGLTFVKMPFPTLEYNSMGNIKGYWLFY